MTRTTAAPIAGPRPDLDLTFAPRVSGDGRLIALVSGDYRIDRYDAGWQAVRTTGTCAGGNVPNLGAVATIETAILLCTRDSADAKAAWDAARPATVTVDGVRYVRADAPVDPDGEEDTYVALVEDDDCRADYDPTRAGAVAARVILRDFLRGRVLPARWTLIRTGVDLIDDETGQPYPDAQWRLADGTAANEGTAAHLSTALDDVAQARDAFYAADAAMGDPYP